MKSRILLILTIVGCFAGCQAPWTSGVMVEKGVLHIDDVAFARNFEVLSESKKHTGAGFLHAQVVLKNNHRRDFKCQYCFEWRDKNGMIQKHAFTSWRPVLIHGREVVELDAVSPVLETESFRLKIRRNN